MHFWSFYDHSSNLENSCAQRVIVWWKYPHLKNIWKNKFMYFYGLVMILLWHITKFRKVRVSVPLVDSKGRDKKCHFVKASWVCIKASQNALPFFLKFCCVSVQWNRNWRENVRRFCSFRNRKIIVKWSKIMRLHLRFHQLIESINSSWLLKMILIILRQKIWIFIIHVVFSNFR